DRLPPRPRPALLNRVARAVMLFAKLVPKKTTTPAKAANANRSADKAANATSPEHTTPGNIVIAESGANKGDFAPGSNKTLILTPPGGRSFNPGAGSVSSASGKDIGTANVDTLDPPVEHPRRRHGPA